MTVLVIGGSREAEGLCARLPDARLIEADSLAGPVEAAAVVDACHPCERVTPVEVAERCAESSVPLLRLRRPAWRPVTGDRWIEVNGAAAAREATIREGWTRIFLCLGAEDRAAFAGDTENWYLVRTRNALPDAISLAQFEVTAKEGPFSVDYETRLMGDHRIDALVTRNAGGEGAAPKIRAARALGLPVVLLNRPVSSAPEVASVDEALDWIERCSAR